MEEPIALYGTIVQLKPLSRTHLPDLVAAANVDRSIYAWSAVPQTEGAMGEYIDTALQWREAGTAVPFAIVRVSDGRVLGSTRFWNIERWAWPNGHPRYGRNTPDACEIGYTWLRADAVRTGANAEAKLIMLSHAFEVWGMLRVCIHTDARNHRSRAAIERLGARFEGTLRSHRLAADATARDSLRYSILSSEWPALKRNLVAAYAAYPIASKTRWVSKPSSKLGSE